MTDLIFYCIVCQFISIVLAIIMWERSALRTEKNVIIRLLHPAVLRIAGARLFEITATIFIFGLFTAQYGKYKNEKSEYRVHRAYGCRLIFLNPPSSFKHVSLSFFTLYF